MLSSKHRHSSAAKTYKIAQSSNFIVRSEHPPKDTVLDQVLKTVEIQLQNKGLLSGFDPENFHPVWFLAETERNVFLWRNGFSLADHDDFEFWLRPRELIEKRLGQLERSGIENPFLNPGWGGSLGEPAPRGAEREYLGSFLALIAKIEAHAHALSLVASLLRREGGGERDRVLLPVKLARRAHSPDEVTADLPERTR
ncbi:MAG: hypothetical protein RL417_1478 [Pseudomonadota bacterium]|jgi:hypothetical protein